MRSGLCFYIGCAFTWDIGYPSFVMQGYLLSLEMAAHLIYSGGSTSIQWL
jgi:hypothetical protein